MTKPEFLELLKENDIDSSFVVFDDPIREGFCIRKTYYRWELFYRERGKEYDCMGFPSESDALQYLLNKLMDLCRTT